MKRMRLENAPRDVQQFVRSLARRPEVIEFEENGHVLLRILAAPQLSTKNKSTLLEEGRELVRRAREQNRDVPSRTLEKEVRLAVNAVRRKTR
jgi:hypothetical protein